MKKQSGSGLIFAVVLLFVILGMVITLSSITVLETKMSQKTKSSIGAFYGAESGVEWALNKIATSTSSSTINTAFSTTAPGNGVQPSGVTDYKVYLLDKDGKVITTNLTVDQVKAVRSVGTQGGETQRAIEAAVASGGGGCYVSYGKPPVAKRAAAPNDNCVTGFTDKGDAGSYGSCTSDSPPYRTFFLPAGGACNSMGSEPGISGDAYVCCM